MAEVCDSDNVPRLVSIDALRGFDMFFIMGGGAIITALCKLYPSGFSSAVAKQMQHVKWDGFAFEDMIFPLFLFIAGISFPFSYAKSLSKGISISKIRLSVLKRALILILLGVIYNNGIQFDVDNMRFCSVLGRIGIAWAFAAMFFTMFSTRIRIVIATVILFAYWGILQLGDWSVEGNIVAVVDRAVMIGRLHQKVFDPEGLLSALPAISTAMLGIFAGEIVKNTKLVENKKVLSLLGLGVMFVLVGLLWDCVLPINKKLWTSSYVCFVGGLSYLLFALFYWVVDVLKFRKWTFFFTVIGMNSITVYMMQKIIYFPKVKDFFFGGTIKLLPVEYQASASAICYTLTVWLFLYILYRKNIFLKV